MRGPTTTSSLTMLALACCACGPQDDPDDPEPNPESICEPVELDGGLYMYPLHVDAWWSVAEIDNQVMGKGKTKVVTVVGEGDVPGKAAATGYKVQSVRDDGYGNRWQAITDEGHIVRHADEWFSTEDGVHTWTGTEVYCPFKFRTPDRSIGYDSALSHTHVCADIHSTGDDPDGECQRVVLDPLTCEPMLAPGEDLPPDCEVTNCGIDREPLPLQSKTRHWKIGPPEPKSVAAVEEDVNAYPVMRSDTAEFPPEPKTFYFTPGIGKVWEEDSGQFEELVECCLPAAGCEAPSPVDRIE